jgi:hypothetical protein
MTPEQMKKMQDARLTKSKLKVKTHAGLSDSQTNSLKGISDHTPDCVSLFSRAFQGVSKAAAVKAKCIECCNFQKAEVKRCDIEGCPLWRYRPYQNKAGKTA